MKKAFLILSLLSTISLAVSAQVKKTAAAGKPVAGLASQMAAGQKVYATYCLTCHQADGAGVQNMNPPLTKTSYVLGDKTRLIKIVLNGFSESVEIEGETYTNVMPPLNILKDAEVANVLTYVRNSFGNKASAITPAEVKKVRGGK